MKKEKTVKTYQRRTKTGKVVTVKQHTAKYDAAEALKEAAKKKGAGDELEALKSKKPEKVKETLSDEELREIDYPQKDIDAVAKALGLTQREAASWMAGTDFSGYRKADMKKGDKAAKKYLGNDVFSKLDPTDADVPLAVLAKLGRKLGGSKFMRVRDLVNTSKAPKAEKAPKSDSSYGFTADEYKAWYHWDQDADPKNAAAKKVEKALKAKMGAKGYKKYFDEMTDSYSSRGHNKAYKALDAEATVPKKDAKTPKSSDSSLKVGSSIQMGNSTSLGKGKKETFKVLAVQNTNKQDRELGNTEAAWVQRKDGSITLALKDSEKGWMYDDTWTDFTDRKHPYAKSLEAAGYSFKKAQGKGGKYWEVSKGSVAPSKETKALGGSKSSTAFADDFEGDGDFFGGRKASNIRKAGVKVKFDGENHYAHKGKLYLDSEDGMIEVSSKIGSKSIQKRIDAALEASKKSSKEDAWKSAPKNSGKYRAGKQKAGAEKEGIASLGIPPKSSKKKKSTGGSGMTIRRLKDETEKKRRSTGVMKGGYRPSGNGAPKRKK